MIGIRMDRNVLRLKDNIYLQKFDSSNKKQTYILICENKRWQISEYLYIIMKLIDGKNTVNDIAEILTYELNREVNVKEIQNVCENFLIKRGILDGTYDSVKTKKLSYLWLRVPLIKSRIIQRLNFLTKLFNQIFSITLIIIGIIVFAYIIFNRVETGFKIENVTKLNNADYVFPIILVLIGSLFHELGHASACMYYNKQPGDIGFAIYFTNPSFYSDVSSAWQLKRLQRVVVDIGGVYFQLVFFIIVGLVGIITSSNILIFSALLGVVLCLGAFNPFIKMDGYWIVSDILGIPNLHDTLKKFILRRIGYLFNINAYVQNTFAEDINEKEKRFFIVYVIGNIVFMSFFIFTITNICHITISKIYSAILDLNTVYGKGLKNITVSIFSNISLIIITIMLLKIIFTTIKGVISGVISIVRNLRTGCLQDKELQI